MKRSIIILMMTGVVFISCGKDELTKEKAILIIRQNQAYPIVLSREIFCGDPEQARILLNAGFEKEGLVKINKNLHYSELGSKAFIEFTPSAVPFLLPTSEEDRKIKVQNVKIAEEDFERIERIYAEPTLGITVVEYSTVFNKVTPFFRLNKDLEVSRKNKRKAEFKLTDNGWELAQW